MQSIPNNLLFLIELPVKFQVAPNCVKFLCIYHSGWSDLSSFVVSEISYFLETSFTLHLHTGTLQNIHSA